MKIVKPSPEHTARFRRMLPADVVVRPMFGCVAGFVDGNMACGTWEEGVMVRLSPEDRLELEDLGGEPFMPGGRRMGSYMLLTPEIVGDDEALGTWIGRALQATRRLPPKAKKAPKPRR